MDINMPEMNGIEATQRILHPPGRGGVPLLHLRRRGPSPAVGASGASAYVNKEQFGADTLRRLWAERIPGRSR